MFFTSIIWNIESNLWKWLTNFIASLLIHCLLLEMVLYEYFMNLKNIMVHFKELFVAKVIYQSLTGQEDQVKRSRKLPIILRVITKSYPSKALPWNHLQLLMLCDILCFLAHHNFLPWLVSQFPNGSVPILLSYHSFLFQVHWKKNCSKKLHWIKLAQLDCGYCRTSLHWCDHNGVFWYIRTTSDIFETRNTQCFWYCLNKSDFDFCQRC